MLESKEQILEMIKKDGNTLQYVPKEFQDDNDVVLEAISNSKTAFSYASDRLKDDESFVKRVIQINSSNFNFATERLRKKRDLALIAVKNKDFNIMSLHSVHKCDEGVVNEAIKSSENERVIEVLNYANKIFKNNRDLILLSIKKSNGEAFKLASSRLQNDKEVVMCAINSTKDSGSLLEYASVEIKKDRDFLMTALMKNANLYLYLPYEFQEDDEFIIATLKEDPTLVNTIPLDFKEDDYFIGIIEEFQPDIRKYIK